MSKKILITGIGGQDGYFLAELLLAKGFTINGLLRRDSPHGLGSLNYLNAQDRDRIVLHKGNVTGKDFIDELIRFKQFEQVYHLAAQSSVARSIKHPRETIETNVIGLTNVATAIRDHSPNTKLIFSGSSEMFGNLTNGKQSESTPPGPQSPYGLTKELGFQLINTYRKHYNLWAATAILFNHESEFRGEQFVTKKIIQSVVRIANGSSNPLSLGNIYARRDWGYARDYMQGLCLMMGQTTPDDYVFATGQLHSVKDFVNIAFQQVNIELEWSGKGLDETARNADTKQILVRIDQRFYRPGDIEGTCGDATKSKQALGWSPTTSLETIISKMIHHKQSAKAHEIEASQFPLT
ncbi:MAG: GDP-mannose 4,6-dehydratase [Opitutales bacterium]